MVSIRKQLVSDTSMKFGRANPQRFLTIHETGNTSPGASAAAHANLQSRAWDWATWHWTVDDKEAVQSYTQDFQLWHAGDGRGSGNMESVAIEFCVNSDRDAARARRNLVELAGKIVAGAGIARTNIVQHNHWSGKDCPHFIRKDGSWGKLVADIWAEAERIRGNSNPVPDNPPSFTGDAASYVGRQIDIDAWWNYKNAADAAALRNPVRVMPAGRYEVTHVAGKTPHLRKTDGKASGWVHSSVLKDRVPVGGKRIHTVVKGDTLWGIGRANGVSVDALRKANGLKGDLIVTGQKLTIP